VWLWCRRRPCEYNSRQNAQSRRFCGGVRNGVRWFVPNTATNMAPPPMEQHFDSVCGVQVRQAMETTLAASADGPGLVTRYRKKKKPGSKRGLPEIPSATMSSSAEVRLRVRSRVRRATYSLPLVVSNLCVCCICCLDVCVVGHRGVRNATVVVTRRTNCCSVFFANEYHYYIPPACKYSLFLRSTDGDNHGNDCNALSTLGLATVGWRCAWHKKATDTMILRYKQSTLSVRAINASTNASTN